MPNTVAHLPVTKDERSLVVPGTTSTEEALTAIKDGLLQAAGSADDISLELDADRDRLRVRFRAVKHRR